MTNLSSLQRPLTLRRGKPMPNRFMLAPLTNQQSNPDGTLSAEEHLWLTMRAAGGFGATMTAAAHVQAVGQGFPGQLGVFDDIQIPALTKMAEAINRTGSVSLVQLHHAGLRSPRAVIGTDPVGPSADEATGTRELSTAEVEQLVVDFGAAARRSEQAGFDGVEIHGAHGYIVAAILSADTNRRTDQYGGDANARAKFLWDVVSEIRRQCSDGFIVGLRLSPERFGLRLSEMVDLAGKALLDERIDFLDMSLWDCMKMPVEEGHSDKKLIDYFTELPRNGAPLGVAGKLRTPLDVEKVLAEGVDFVLLGRAAILNHDFPNRAFADPNWSPRTTPVDREALIAEEGVSAPFAEYLMGSFKGFIS